MRPSPPSLEGPRLTSRPTSWAPGPRILPVVLAFLSLTVPGCLDGEPSPTDVLERSFAIEPDGFAEVNLRMDRNASIRYDWTVEDGTSVRFDVHSHENDRVVVHEQTRAASGSGSFQAPEDGTFSLMWENTGDQPVRVSTHVEGTFELASVTG